MTYDPTQLENLVCEAITLHRQEKHLTLRSTLLVGKLEEERAAFRYGMASAGFAQKIGLSIDQYWKRAQAARIMRRFPETQSMVEQDEISVTSLALLSPKLTPANAAVLLNGIRGKSKRAIREFLSTVALDGQILEQEPTIEFKITLTKSQTKKLDRAFEVLAARGQIPELSQVVEQALDALLWRRDPLQKAERAKKRSEKIATAPAQAANVTSAPVPTAPAQRPKIVSGRRVQIPAAVRHQIWLVNEGQCSWHHPGGERCFEKKMLELDHIHMVCRGGTDDAENLTLRCRFHNQ